MPVTEERKQELLEVGGCRECVGGSSFMRIHDCIQRPSLGDVCGETGVLPMLEQVYCTVSPTHPLSHITPHRTAPHRTAPHHTNPTHPTHQEAKAIGDDFLQLEKYINLNYMGFHKILKKHDKLLPHSPCRQFYISHLHHQPWVQVEKGTGVCVFVGGGGLPWKSVQP